MRYLVEGEIRRDYGKSGLCGRGAPGTGWYTWCPCPAYLHPDLAGRRPSLRRCNHDELSPCYGSPSGHRHVRPQPPRYVFSPNWVHISTRTTSEISFCHPGIVRTQSTGQRFAQTAPSHRYSYFSLRLHSPVSGSYNAGSLPG